MTFIRYDNIIMLSICLTNCLSEYDTIVAHISNNANTKNKRNHI